MLTNNLARLDDDLPGLCRELSRHLANREWDVLRCLDDIVGSQEQDGIECRHHIERCAGRKLVEQEATKLGQEENRYTAAQGIDAGNRSLKLDSGDVVAFG